MGALLSIPLLGSVAGLGGSALSACVSGLAFFCTGQAVSLPHLSLLIPLSFPTNQLESPWCVCA